MNEVLLVDEGRCPTCGQPRWRAVECTCGHTRATHALGTARSAVVRTGCSHSDCGCRKFDEVQP